MSTWVLRPSYLVPSWSLRSVATYSIITNSMVLRPYSTTIPSVTVSAWVLRPSYLSSKLVSRCVMRSVAPSSILTTYVVLRPYSTTLTSVTLCAWVLRPSYLSSKVVRPSTHVGVESLVVRWLRGTLNDLWLLRPAPSSSSLVLAVLGHRRLYSS
jgi:hypothetical protein